jgi:pimeloyl-ACP methyl ester carboxylesterase
VRRSTRDLRGWLYGPDSLQILRDIASVSGVMASPRLRSHRWLANNRSGKSIASLAISLVLAFALTPDSGVGAAVVKPSGIAWSPCPKMTGYLCGSLLVPIDYRQPSRGSLRLAVIEHPASDSKGVIVFNPGGPGESGVTILPILASLVPPSVRNQFTLVSFDERGTGASDPLLCGPSPVAAGSAVAGTVAAMHTFSGLDRSCRSRYPGVFPTVDTTTSARDMDRLRAALGVDRINYYGVSYGTVLGSVYRQLFPTHVRSMVLDGAVDANLSLPTDATLEAPAIQTALKHALSDCPATSGCALGPNPVASYEGLAAQLARSPLPAPGNGDNAPVTVGDLMTATLLYLSAPTLTPGYFPALAAAAAGNGAPLRAVALGLETDLNGNSLVGALWSITCNDAVAHPNGASTASLARALAAHFPLGGAEAVANNLIGCPGWTDSAGAIAHLIPIRSQPPLVIGNTYDPNTPYAVARRLAPAIGGRLVTYVGYGHSWLLNGSASICMQDVVSTYFIDDVLPAPGTRCAAAGGH